MEGRREGGREGGREGVEGKKMEVAERNKGQERKMLDG